jgi:hypothetical protein
MYWLACSTPSDVESFPQEERIETAFLQHDENDRF